MLEVGGVKIYGYGLLIGLGVWLAMEIAEKKADINGRLYEMAMWWVVGGGLLGARIYHVVDYWDRYYVNNIDKIFYLWEGGLGIIGALVGGFTVLALFCYFNKLNFKEIADSMIVGVPLAQAIGRVGNFINGELYGKNGEPLFLYEGILNLLLFGILWKISTKQKQQGVVVGIYLLGYGIIRILLENLRPLENIWKINNIPMAVIFCILGMVVGGYLIFRRKRS